MKFAFSSNAFTRYSLTDTIKILSEIGYEGIEIMADVPHAYPPHFTVEDIRDTQKLLSESGLEIANINAFMHYADGDTYHPSWIEQDPGERARRIDYTLNCIDLAAELGAGHILTEPGGPLEGISREEGLRRFREGLGAVEERAREKGIRILIEPEPGLLIENSSQFQELFIDLDPRVFGLNFDIGHFFCVGENPSALIPKLKDCTRHFHLEDIAASRRHHHLLLGEGAIDLPGVLDTIHESGFSGFVTVELYTCAAMPEAAARDAFKYLQDWKKTRGHATQIKPRTISQ